MSLQIEDDSVWNPYAKYEETIESLRQQLADAESDVDTIAVHNVELQQQLAEKDSEIERLKKQSARRLIGACSRGEANDELRLQLAAIRDELLAARNWPVMGYGKVAIGGGLQPDGSSALLYMDMGETRPIDTDTTDLFPVGSYAEPAKLLACVYFKDSAAIQQTIEVLQEMQTEIASVQGSA